MGFEEERALVAVCGRREGGDVGAESPGVVKGVVLHRLDEPADECDLLSICVNVEHMALVCTMSVPAEDAAVHGQDQHILGRELHSFGPWVEHLCEVCRWRMGAAG